MIGKGALFPYKVLQISYKSQLSCLKAEILFIDLPHQPGVAWKQRLYRISNSILKMEFTQLKL